MPRTGETSHVSGIFRSVCCGYETIEGKSEPFSSCRACSKVADWTLLRPAILQKTT